MLLMSGVRSFFFFASISKGPGGLTDQSVTRFSCYQIGAQEAFPDKIYTTAQECGFVSYLWHVGPASN